MKRKWIPNVDMHSMIITIAEWAFSYEALTRCFYIDTERNGEKDIPWNLSFNQIREKKITHLANICKK